jgi:hypothetical protein
MMSQDSNQIAWREASQVGKPPRFNPVDVRIWKTNHCGETIPFLRINIDKVENFGHGISIAY